MVTLGQDLFGDRVNLFNGAVSFEQTDVSLTGNNALPVAVTRTYSPRSWIVQGVLADWDLSTPRVEGTFPTAEGWIPGFGSAATRCSGYDAPPQVSRGAYSPQDFPPWEYGQGINLVIPGQGSQEILKRAAANTLKPPSGTYDLVTSKQWQIGCLTDVLNAAGEGFTALAPDGVRYTFNWLASRSQTPLRKGDAQLGRSDMYLELGHARGQLRL